MLSEASSQGWRAGQVAMVTAALCDTAVGSTWSQCSCHQQVMLSFWWTGIEVPAVLPPAEGFVGALGLPSLPYSLRITESSLLEKIFKTIRTSHQADLPSAIIKPRLLVLKYFHFTIPASW